MDLSGSSHDSCDNDNNDDNNMSVAVKLLVNPKQSMEEP